MPKGFIDCYKCNWSHRLYDHTGKWTGAVFCSKRNGKIRRRFRGECKYIAVDFGGLMYWKRNTTFDTDSPQTEREGE